MQYIDLIKSCVFGGAIPVLSTTLLLAACGDPAPGEGMEKLPIEEPMPKVVPAPEAVQSPDIASIDPTTMEEAEIDKVIPQGPRCRFAYTAASRPILAAGIAAERGIALGVIKIHGRLIEVTASEMSEFKTLADGAIFTADGLRLEVSPIPNEAGTRQKDKWRRPSHLRFELEQGLRVDYRGWYTCDIEQ